VRRAFQTFDECVASGGPDCAAEKLWLQIPFCLLSEPSSNYATPLKVLADQLESVRLFPCQENLGFSSSSTNCGIQPQDLGKDKNNTFLTSSALGTQYLRSTEACFQHRAGIKALSPSKSRVSGPGVIKVGIRKGLGESGGSDRGRQALHWALTSQPAWLSWLWHVPSGPREPYLGHCCGPVAPLL
jgi:hypothetical protein